MEIGVSQVGIKLIQSILRLGRQREYSLEQEIEVRIAAHDSSVERVLAVCSGCRNSGITVFEHVKSVNLDGIDCDSERILVDDCCETGAQIAFADRNRTADNPAYIQFFSGNLAAERKGPYVVNDIAQVRVCPYFTELGTQCAPDSHSVEKSAHFSGICDGRALAEFPEPQIDLRRPAFDEAFKSGGCE